jgi:hypothetical protein
MHVGIGVRQHDGVGVLHVKLNKNNTYVLVFFSDLLYTYMYEAKHESYIIYEREKKFKGKKGKN